MQHTEDESIMAEDPLALAAAKKENILERLNKRNKDRQNYLDVKSEQRSKENLQLEGVDYFSHTFAERVREVQTRIQNITDAAAKKNTGDAPNPDLARIFSDITVEIQELQRYLTTSTMFLSDYKIKACQNILNELTTSSEETRVKLLPKKKFGFSGKKSSKPAKVKELATPTDKLDAGSMSTLSNTIFSWTISNRSNEYICLTENEVNGKDLTISALDHCFVELQGHPGSLQITNASHCVFLCGPIARSLFAEFCSDSSIAGACQQLRLHSSRNMQLYIHVTCRAIIEDCKEIKVSTYNYDYPSMAEDFVAAGLDRSHNNYTDIADFNWLSPDVPSPNWHLVKDINQSAPDWQQLRSSFKEQQQNGSGLNKHNL